MNFPESLKGQAVLPGSSYQVLPGTRPKSLEIENRMTSPDETVFGSGPDDLSRGACIGGAGGGG